MSNNLLNTVYDILKKDDRLISQDWDLLKNKIQELAYNLDENLISLLLDDEITRNKFFIDIKDVKVFDSNKFIRFVDNKQFLPDSYTSYKNKIGLINKNWDYLAESNEISLAWAYKDCILAWGQDKEDSKREEVFYNDILWSDEIDVLLWEKTYTNFKKVDKDWEHKLESFNKDENWNIKDNLLIRWNNLLTLYSLEKKFAWSVDLIYIDPPYNTWGNWDTFQYNNKFKHSSWLTFMKNRLDIAKKLLKKDWSIIVAIDENEFVYLWVLLDEIFNGYEKHCISIVHNPRGIQWTNFSYTNEFAFFVIPEWKKTVLDRKIDKDEIEWSKFRNWWSESERKDAKNCFYPIIVEEWKITGFWDVLEDWVSPKSQTEKVWNKHYIYPIDTKWVERKWRYARQSVDAIKHLLKVKEIKWWGYDIEIWKDFWQYKTVWVDNRYDSNEYGTKLVKDLVPWCKFSFPKSLWNVYDCLYSIVWKKKDALVLDFFWGSWTTAHAVLELNKDDGWNRKFILTEQMDYIDTVTKERIKEVIKRNWEDEFVYMEMVKQNESFVSMIDDTKSTDDLIKIWEQIKESAFINYSVNISDIDNSIEDFRALSIEEQKAFLMDILDKNLLYLNYSEIEDKNNKVSDEDIKLNNNFYK